MEAKTTHTNINAKADFGQLGKSILQSLPIGVVAFDKDLKIIEANGQATKLIQLNDGIDESLSAGTDSKMWRDWTEQLQSVITNSKTCTFDNVPYTRAGKTRLLQIICSPLNLSENQTGPAGIIIIEDVTEKVNIQRQLANSERLATVGKLASKVAHELNNPMDGILRYINLAIRIIEQKNLEKPKEYLAQCRQGLMRMVQIVSELLEFSRNTYSPFEQVKIERIIDDAIKSMDTSAEVSNVKISTNYAPNLPKIGTGNLFQVFCNLIKNAIAAMPNGGDLSISTELTADKTIVIKFCDTGIGFAPENTEIIFEPFFTTKERGKGTGLGLAICKDIIERYNGRITAENRGEGGSIFTVYLPTEGST